MSTSETVFIVDSQHGVSNGSNWNDLDYEGGTRHRRLIEPPPYFDGCLALTDAKAIFDGMSAWDAACDDVPVTCPSGG